MTPFASSLVPRPRSDRAHLQQVDNHAHAALVQGACKSGPRAGALASQQRSLDCQKVRGQDAGRSTQLPLLCQLLVSTVKPLMKWSMLPGQSRVPLQWVLALRCLKHLYLDYEHAAAA